MLFLSDCDVRGFNQFFVDVRGSNSLIVNNGTDLPTKRLQNFDEDVGWAVSIVVTAMQGQRVVHKIVPNNDFLSVFQTFSE